MATFIVTNTPQRGTLGQQNPVSAGRYRAQATAAPGAAWMEVSFGGLAFAEGGDLLVASSLDAGLRLFVGDAAPGAASAGWEMPPGSALPLSVFPGDRVFVRSL